MAIDATEILLKNSNEHKLTPEDCRAVCHTAQYTQTPQESIAIDIRAEPKIIVSASGMMTGGRISHHLKVYGPNPRNTILMTGFQAEGTRGARMLHHEPTVKIHGEQIPIEHRFMQLVIYQRMQIMKRY